MPRTVTANRVEFQCGLGHDDVFGGAMMTNAFAARLHFPGFPGIVVAQLLP